MDKVALELALIAALVLINGVLSGSELAIVSARRHRLQQRAEAGDRGARRALELAAEPNRFLSTVQIGITLVGILAGVFGGATVAEQVAARFELMGLSPGAAAAAGVGAVVLAITYLSLVVGELVPKRLALAHPEGIAAFVAAPVRALSVAATPIVAVLSVSTELVLRAFRMAGNPERSLTEEELRMVLLESTRIGLIEEAEQELASAALQLGDRRVSDVMTPRPEVTWIDAGDPAEANLERIAASPHHWFPVIEEGADVVLGVIAVRDLFRASVRGEPGALRSLMRPVPFVPESLSLVTALEQMRRSEVPLAVVVDEYGGTNGIVTITDVLGAVVGELGPEPSVPDMVRRDDGSWLVDGRVTVQKLGEALGLSEMDETGAYQTVAGFVLHRLGRIPAVGERFEWAGWRFEVADMDLRRVDRVLIWRG